MKFVRVEYDNNRVAGAGAIKVLAQQAVQCKVVIAHLDICLADAAVCGLGQRHGVLGHGHIQLFGQRHQQGDIRHAQARFP